MAEATTDASSNGNYGELVRTYLKNEYSRRVLNNRRYSLRAFARSLKIDPSTLSQIMRGKRPVTQERARELLKYLELSPSQRSKLDRANGAEPAILLEDQREALEAWHYYAIRELIKTREFVSDEKWIAERLGLPVSLIQDAMERLERLNIVCRDENQKWILSSQHVTTVKPDEYTTVALRRLQKSFLDISKEALDEVPISERDHSGVTFPILRDKVGEAKELIKKFRREFMALIEDEIEGEEVYQLQIGFYPLTKREKNESH